MCERSSAPLSLTLRTRRLRGRSSRRLVENTAAILATHNFFPSSSTRCGCTCHFHVAAGADSVLDRDHRGVAFALKKTFEETKQILIDFSLQVCAFPGQFV